MRHLLSLLVLVALPACGSSDPKELTSDGYTALNSGRFRAALTDFEDALAAIGTDTAHAEYIHARLGRVEARIRIDPEAAREDFLALVETHPSALGDREYSMIGGKFANANALRDAIVVLDTGMKAQKQAGNETALLAKLLARIKEDAERAGDAGALGDLESLGYL